MGFEFATASRILFGCGKLKEAGPIARELGRRALVVTGKSAARVEGLITSLRQHSIECATFAVAGEPTVELVQRGIGQGRQAKTDFIIAIGGGSVIDAGKAIGALLANEGDPFDYLEVIGRGKPLTKPSAPVIAIPTTAGTGAEVTRNAVLGSPPHRVKVSLRSPLMLPRVAIVDPELTRDLPPAITASTGLDALTQLIEPFVSSKANPMTDGFCREGMARAARSLRRAFEQGGDMAAWEDMALASLFGGLALANAGLGAVHGFAGPLGGMFPAAHGAVCAALLPHVMAANVRALRAQQPESEALRRYDEVARIVTGRDNATADDGVVWMRELCGALGVPPLAAHGVMRNDFAALVEKAATASSMKGNPVALTREELFEILDRALE
ncbi:MAG: iron-containing alcohol dehydrogenase [Verrucomicrobia bacterium]|nr:iron-containing alcohol dehydrogenase [Verrucomicrobiota bacterium]